MSALARTSVIHSEENSITTISANARVDYILRFTKQAVLVVDENSNRYSHVGSQFLGSLPANHNAAFISISPKLNDLQIRCRLIEQLFSDTLFDPEQSLVVTILRIAKDKPEAISIVIEHAHYLSLQMFHELCQIVDVAKKSNLKIDVVLLGEPQTGELVSSNKSIFLNKISILSAQTGQLITFDSKLFKKKKGLINNTISKVVIYSLLGLIIFSALIFISFSERDTLSFSGLAKVDEQQQVTLQEKNKGFSKLSALQPKKKSIDVLTQATVHDIYTAIVRPQLPDVNVTARPDEIVQAISQYDIQDIVNNEEVVIEQVIKQQISTSSDTSVKIPGRYIDTNYFKAAKTGYVIQIAGFSNDNRLANFLSEYNQLSIFAYRRLLNNKKFVIITSQIYTDKAEARAGIEYLPLSLQENDVWIKSIAAINSEINVFESSQ